ncbi:MAG: nucleotidyltransferase [Eubacterium sp.]|nr:nucleotidyltransferase [Eubacterium sp.]
MDKPILVVMAAGMGSRFGGLKQIADADGKGHALIDYAVADALRAGFGEVVFIIRKDISDDFIESVGKRIQDVTKVTYVYQDLSMIPDGEEIPEGRVKPWGTTHAIWCAREVLKGRQFLTVNADDFYGEGAYRVASDFFSRETDADVFANIGYEVVGTLSDKGTVSRGICKVKDGNLVRIDERKKIKLENGKGFYTLDDGATFTEISADAVASMNMWAFNAGFIDDISESFEQRLRDGIKAKPLSFEETLSEAVQNMMERNAASVRVLPTDEEWMGMTYQEDMPLVRAHLLKLIDAGAYPEFES